MLPREGTETGVCVCVCVCWLITHVTSRGDGNFSFEGQYSVPLLVNNPCYLERGRKPIDFVSKLTKIYKVNNPCYLERGRKLYVCNVY